MKSLKPGPAVVSVLPVQFVVELVNEWGTTPREAAGEQGQDYPDFAALAVAHQIDPTVTRMSDESLTDVADSLYPVFSAATDDAVVVRVNDLLALGAAQPWLGQDSGSLTAKWTSSASRRLQVACVLTLFQQLVQWGDSARLGLCTGAHCADAYADLSSAGHKRYCSLICQNRNRLAAFRARRRQADGPGQ